MDEFGKRSVQLLFCPCNPPFLWVGCSSVLSFLLLKCHMQRIAPRTRIIQYKYNTRDAPCTESMQAILSQVYFKRKQNTTHRFSYNLCSMRPCAVCPSSLSPSPPEPKSSCLGTEISGSISVVLYFYGLMPLWPVPLSCSPSSSAVP